MEKTTFEGVVKFATKQGEINGAAADSLFAIGCKLFDAARAGATNADAGACKVVYLAYAKARNAKAHEQIDVTDESKSVAAQASKLSTYGKVAAKPDVPANYFVIMKSHLNALEVKRVALHEAFVTINRAQAKADHALTRDEVGALFVKEEAEPKTLRQRLERMAKDTEKMFKDHPYAQAMLAKIGLAIQAAIKDEDIQAARRLIADTIIDANLDADAAAKAAMDNGQVIDGEATEVAPNDLAPIAAVIASAGAASGAKPTIHFTN